MSDANLGFVNPFNFVPFVSSELPEDLAQRPPLGHDRWHEGTFSGRLVMSLETITPLLTVELTRMEGDLQVMSVRRDVCNRPIVSGSSVKGMIRSMYEQVTGSRLAVFDHDIALTYKTSTGGRASCDRSPADLLGNSRLPARSFDEFTAADRLFGWVRDGKAAGPVAYRGQCRVGAVTHQGAAPPPQKNRAKWKLATLNSPKPEQARFYTRNVDGSATDGRRKDRAYREGDILAGHKAYLHQIHDQDYWALGPGGWSGREEVEHPKHAGAYQNFLAAKGTPDKVAVAITDWVPPGEEFRTTLYFDNVTHAELGALLWVLELGEGRYHRLGLGRPLGFGSVAVSIDYERSTVQAYAQRRAEYCSLRMSGEGLPAGEVKKLRDGFDKWFREAAPATATALLAAASGTALPVHYPRLGEPDESGQVAPQQESFKWFEQNEASPGNGRPAPRRALPVLGSDDSQWLLPFDPQQP